MNSDIYQKEETQKQNIFIRSIKFIFDSVQTLVISLAMFVVVYTFILSPTEVIGSSMFPNLEEKEIILTEKFSGKIGNFKRGDIVIIKYSDTKDIVKRVIGLPGEKVKLQEGKVFINNKELEESYLPKGTYTESYSEFMKENEEKLIPSDAYFVLGDNRSVSQDSRIIGFISPSTYPIKGKVMFIYWPLDKVKLPQEVKYNL